MESAYIQDILSQPQALRDLLEHFDPGALEPVRNAIAAGQYDRILITGMGASFYGMYPALFKLAKLHLPVVLWETAELLHYALEQVSARSLLWIVSQSGESIEIRRLLERLSSQRPKLVLGTTNQPGSTLGQASDLILPLHAASEHTVSTRTYVNTLALGLLAATTLLGEPIAPLQETLWQAQEAMSQLLGRWSQQVDALRRQVGQYTQLYLLGRGPSLASARAGALFLKEAAKFPAEGMETAQFRHGPLEIVSPTVGVWVFGGGQTTLELNRNLALEARRYGGYVTWVSPGAAEALEWISLPAVAEVTLPLLEIVPVQALTIVLAEAGGFEPGQFRYMGKITTQE